MYKFKFPCRVILGTILCLFFIAPAKSAEITKLLENVFGAEIDKLEQDSVCRTCGCKLWISNAEGTAPTDRLLKFQGAINAKGKTWTEKFNIRVDVFGEISITDQENDQSCKLVFVKKPELKIEEASGVRVCLNVAWLGAKSEFASGKSTNLTKEHCEQVRMIHQNLN